MTPRGATGTRKSKPTNYIVFRQLKGLYPLTLELVGTVNTYGAVQAGNEFKDANDERANGYVAIPLSNFTVLGGEIVRPEPEFRLAREDAAKLLAPPTEELPVPVESVDTEPAADALESAERLQVA